mgnify:CR=1 FL=1
MSSAERSSPPRATLDPVVKHGRREAAVILLVWFSSLVWTIGYTQTYGYEVPEGGVATVLGMPAWVFWGVALPWVLATLFNILFAVFFMANDDLGESLEPPPEQGNPS